MTRIGDLTVNVPVNYNYQGAQVRVTGTMNLNKDLKSLEEMFALVLGGPVLRVMPGARHIGLDNTPDRRLTQYVKFTHGDKPKTGWYILAGFQDMQDESPLGFAQNFQLELIFVGTNAMYQPGFRLIDLEKEDNDWDI